MRWLWLPVALAVLANAASAMAELPGRAGWLHREWLDAGSLPAEPAPADAEHPEPAADQPGDEFKSISLRFGRLLGFSADRGFGDHHGCCPGNCEGNCGRGCRSRERCKQPRFDFGRLRDHCRTPGDKCGCPDKSLCGLACCCKLISRHFRPRGCGCVDVASENEGVSPAHELDLGLSPLPPEPEVEVESEEGEQDEEQGDERAVRSWLIPRAITRMPLGNES